MVQLESDVINGTTYSRVRDRLREDILSGFFKPGVRLRIIELANRYCVSVMPIREALQQLQGEGIVNLLPQKGASVRKVDEQFVSNMYDVRLAIERMLVRNGVRNLTDEIVSKLEDIQSQYELYAHDHKLDTLLKLNEQFHKTINGLAQNPEAIQIIDRHWGLIDSLRHKFGFDPNRMDEIIDDHRRLIQALKNRDAERAADVTEEHVIKAKTDLMARIKLADL